ncbi:MAG: glycosyltransferase [Rhodobacteraceae bacterium]|nr:glycosyltransferase [Paracoccaceae bacterium]
MSVLPLHTALLPAPPAQPAGAGAAQWTLHPRAHPPDPQLTDRLGVTFCLASGLLPWRQVAGQTVVAAPSAEVFLRHLPRLTAALGPVVPALCPADEIEAALMRMRGPALALRAETSVAEPESCRSYRLGRVRAVAVVGLALLVLATALAPLAVLAVMTGIAVLATLGFSLLKLAAWVRVLTARPPPSPVTLARLPTVSIMVALYHEADIAARLVARLDRLDYPRALLDVLLVVEADDHLTRAALARAGLPGWMRVVAVPNGPIRTKPRALNHALDFCRGSLVGVYDAEDAPEPDQLQKMVAHFHARGPEVACLQGRLDYYNPRVNWLSRCFTVEYAAWFRLFLPGVAQLGLAVPLGGTTLFFRREVLEKLGRWDACNVTEDADLGIRLARHGYVTELLDSTTFEEANCRARPWIKQRSRWIKGFMMTWLTHMRDPARLWRELGVRRFLGVQLLLLGSVLQALTAPFLWAFWLVPLEVGHPVEALLGPVAFRVLWITFFAVEGLTITFAIAGLRRTAHGLSPLWVPTLSLYHVMATAAAWKAAWEMLTRPFWWDKTHHGLFDAGG